MLTTCFYLHNEKQQARQSKARVRMVEEVSDDCLSSQQTPQECFGLSFDAPTPTPQDTSVEAIDVEKSTYLDVVKHFTVYGKTHTHAPRCVHEASTWMCLPMNAHTHTHARTHFFFTPCPLRTLGRI